MKATYPLEAHAQNLQGQVVIKVLVSETGDVEKAELISGDPVFVKPALEAAKQWKFKPFIQNGKAIKFATRIPFDFAFSEAVKDVAPTVTTAPDGSKLVMLPQGGAVQQWIYKPYLLNGEPIAVDTQIVVHFGHTVD